MLHTPVTKIIMSFIDLSLIHIVKQQPVFRWILSAVLKKWLVACQLPVINIVCKIPPTNQAHHHFWYTATIKKANPVICPNLINRAKQVGFLKNNLLVQNGSSHAVGLANCIHFAKIASSKLQPSNRVFFNILNAYANTKASSILCTITRYDRASTWLLLSLYAFSIGVSRKGSPLICVGLKNSSTSGWRAPGAGLFFDWLIVYF